MHNPIVQLPYAESGRSALNPGTGSRVSFAAFAARLAVSIAIAAIASAVLTYAVSFDPPDKRPEKVARLFFIATFLATYLPLWRKHRPRLAVASALPGTEGRLRLIAQGFAAGAGSLVVFLGVSIVTGWWRPLPEPEPWLKILGRAVFYLPAGLFLAFWEEGLFRGVIFGDAARASGVRTAMVTSCLLFSWSHMIGPLPGTAVAWSSPHVGVEAIGIPSPGVAEEPRQADMLQGHQGVLVGAVMKRSGGRADPRKVNQLLAAKLAT